MTPEIQSFPLDGSVNPVVCTYDLTAFGGDIVVDVMRTHPKTIFVGTIQELIPRARQLADIESLGSSLDHARDAIDLVAPTVDASVRFLEHTIFSEDLVDGCAPTRRVVFTEDVVKIARYQDRYGVGDGLSPLGIE